MPTFTVKVSSPANLRLYAFAQALPAIAVNALVGAGYTPSGKQHPPMGRPGIDRDTFSPQRHTVSIEMQAGPDDFPETAVADFCAHLVAEISHYFHNEAEASLTDVTPVWYPVVTLNATWSSFRGYRFDPDIPAVEIDATGQPIDVPATT